MDSNVVVVVDDDEGVRQAFQRVLEAAGFAPRVFASAESLLDSGDAPGAACLILDVQLPGISGFELCRQLRAGAGPAPPVVFITAHDSPSARDHARTLGAGYLSKPVTGRALLGAVTQLIGSGR